MYPAGMHGQILRDAVEKCVRGFMIPSQMTSLTQSFYGRTLPSFSFAERTCAAIFLLGGPNEHLTSKLFHKSKSTNHQERK